MMAALPIEFNQFTFIDLGSGKGRTLLMASDFPFRKILGVEILRRAAPYCAREPAPLSQPIAAMLGSGSTLLRCR